VTKDTVNAEEIDGYRGNDDLDRILEFIEAKPDQDKSVKPVVKRNRKPDKKAKRSRTPSAAPSVTKETSAEPEKDFNSPEPEKDLSHHESEMSRSESSPPESVSIVVSAAAAVASKPPKAVKPAKPSSTQNLGTLISSYITSSSNQKSKHNSKQTSPTSETSKSRSTDRMSSERKSSNPTAASNQSKEIVSKETSPSEQPHRSQIADAAPNNSVPDMCYNDANETNFETPSEVEELDVEDEPVPKLEGSPPTEVPPNSSFSVQELKAVQSQSQNQVNRDQTQQPGFNYESILKFVKSGN
jgi:hypothetical protein